MDQVSDLSRSYFASIVHHLSLFKMKLRSCIEVDIWHFSDISMREKSQLVQITKLRQKLSDMVKLIDSFFPCHAKASGIAFNLPADTYESYAHVADWLTSATRSHINRIFDYSPSTGPQVYSWPWSGQTKAVIFANICLSFL